MTFWPSYVQILIILILHNFFTSLQATCVGTPQWIPSTPWVSTTCFGWQSNFLHIGYFFASFKLRLNYSWTERRKRMHKKKLVQMFRNTVAVHVTNMERIWPTRLVPDLKWKVLQPLSGLAMLGKPLDLKMVSFICQLIFWTGTGTMKLAFTTLPGRISVWDPNGAISVPWFGNRQRKWVLESVTERKSAVEETKWTQFTLLLVIFRLVMFGALT